MIETLVSLEGTRVHFESEEFDNDLSGAFEMSLVEAVAATVADADPYFDPVTIGELGDLRQAVESELSTKLKPRERVVIIRRFGLSGREPETLQAIAADLDLSGARVRQIEEKALRKLRHPSCILRWWVFDEPTKEELAVRSEVEHKTATPARSVQTPSHSAITDIQARRSGQQSRRVPAAKKRILYESPPGPAAWMVTGTEPQQGPPARELAATARAFWRLTHRPTAPRLPSMHDDYLIFIPGAGVPFGWRPGTILDQTTRDSKDANPAYLNRPVPQDVFRVTQLGRDHRGSFVWVRRLSLFGADTKPHTPAHDAGRRFGFV